MNVNELNRELRYAVYMSGRGRRITKALEKSPKLAQRIVLAVSDNPCNLFLHDFFKKNDIQYYLMDFDEIKAERKKKNEILSDYMLELFKKNEIDYCFSFGNHLLKGELLKVYANRIINFHPSLLPHFTGFNALQRAKEHSERFVGNTAHFIDEGIDNGSIILQNVMLLEADGEFDIEAILDEQVTLLLKIDELLVNNRIVVVDNVVKIKKANYSISHLYPQI